MKKIVAYLLCLMMVLSVLAVGLASEAVGTDEVEFVVPKVVPAKGIEDFIGKWFICKVVYEDGKIISREEMIEEDGLQDGSQDGEADMAIFEDRISLFDMDEEEGEPVIKPVFVPEDGTLKIVNGSDETPVLRMNDNGMLSCFVQISEEEQYTVYFVRK